MIKRGIFSKALFAENLKRFWAVSAVGFVIYFISGPFLLLANSRYYSPNTDLDMMDYFSRWALLKNQNLGFEAMHFILPVVAAVCVFSYLNRVNSVGVVHSMPFSRRMLFVTDYFSGLVLCLMPLLVNWGLLVAASMPYMGTIRYLNRSMIAGWFVGSFTIVLFVFSIAVLACMVSGNSVIAVLTGAALNFIAAVLVICVYGYAARFLYGFSGDAMWRIAARTTPLIWMPVNGGLLIHEIIVYIVIALIVTVLAFLLYKARRLERCGDSYVFSWMQTVTGFLFVFIVTTLTGLVLFDGIGSAAYIVGFVIGFIVGQMITFKTFNIINLTCLKNFVVFALIMIAVVCAFRFDIFGYQKKVPEAGDVASVEITSPYINADKTMRAVTFTSDETVRSAVALHQEIVEDHAQNGGGSIYEYGGERLIIRYTLKDGRTLSRDFDPVDFKYYAESENFEKLRHSKEIISSIDALRNLKGDMRFHYFDLRDMSAEVNDYNFDLSDEDQKELLNALADDMMQIQTLSSASIDRNSWLDIILKDDHETEEEAEKYWSGYYGYLGYHYEGNIRYIELSFSLDSSCKNTMDLLKEKGYAK